MASHIAGICHLDRRPIDDRTADRFCRQLGVSASDRDCVARGDGFLLIAKAGLTFDRSAGRVVLADGIVETAPAVGRSAYLLDCWDKGDVHFARIHGDFVSAQWDARERRLRLRRPPASLRSLYYHHAPAAITFASDLRLLMASPDVPREIDEEALADTISVNLDPSDRSVWRGVVRVGGGWTVTVASSGLTRERWWDVREARTVRFRKDADYVEAGRAVLASAIETCCPTQGPIAVAASAGLDSVNILASLDTTGRVTHALTRVPLEGTRGFRSWRYPDERPYLPTMRDYWPRIRFEVIESGEAEESEWDARSAFVLQPTPLASPSTIGWFLPLYRRVHDLGFDTIITGDWGDATISFSGSHYPARLLRQGRWFSAFREIVALRAAAPSGGHPGLQALRQAFEPSFLTRWRQRRSGKGVGEWSAYVGVNREFATRVDLNRRLVANGFPGGDEMLLRGVRGALDWFLIRDRHTMEAASMMRALTGVSPATPYSDRRVLEFCAGIPDNQFLRNGVSRWLARRMLAGRAPPSLAANPRKGEQGADWYAHMTRRRGHIFAEIEELQTSSLAARVLDLKRLHQLADKWPKDDSEAFRRAALYQGILRRALHVGQFLRWVDQRNQ